MNSILPLTTVVALGAASGFILRRLRWPLFLRAVTAALLATLLWGVGVYLFLAALAPNELGPPLAEPIILTFLTAFPAAFLAGMIKHSEPGGNS